MSSPNTIPSPLTTPLLQTLGLTTTLILAGQTLTLSTFLVPRLLQSPAPLLLSQWNATYQSGKKSGPVLALVSGGIWIFLGYTSHINSVRILGGGAVKKTWGYFGAAALVIGIIPYTFLVLKGTNGTLLGRVEGMSGVSVMGQEGEVKIDERRGDGGESVHVLVDRWGVLNLGRAFMMAASGVLGAWTALH